MKKEITEKIVKDLYKEMLGETNLDQQLIQKTIGKYQDVSLLVHHLLNSSQFKKTFLELHPDLNWIFKAKGIYTSGNHISLVFPTYDRFQLSHHMRKGDYNKKEFQAIFNYLRNRNLLVNNGLFLDVGANVGTHTIYALQEPEVRKAFAIEPSSSNVFFLNLNLKLNNLNRKVKVIPSALGDINGNIKLYSNPIHCGDKRLEARSTVEDKENLFNEPDFQHETVPICTFVHLMIFYKQKMLI